MLNLRRDIFFALVMVLFFCAEGYALEYNDGTIVLDPIVITSPKAFLGSSYALTKEQAKTLPFTSAIESLSLAPVDLQSRALKGDIQTDFSLRGSTFQGVLMLLNGQRINDPQTAHHNADIPFTKADIERLEVIPGAASSLFGPDAIGGAVNMVLKKPDVARRIIETSIGSYQTGRGLASVTEKVGPFGLRVSAERMRSSGFYDDTDFLKSTLSCSSLFEFAHGSMHANFGYQDKEFGAYDFYTPQSGFLSKEWTKTLLGDFGLNVSFAGFTIKPNLIWRKHNDKFALDRTTVRSRYLNHHRTNVFTPNLYLQRNVKGLGLLGLGVEYGEERIKSSNLGKQNRQHRSIFIDDTNELSDFLSYGTSFRWDNYDGFDSVFTGSANLRYKFLTHQVLHFGISRNMRVPSFTELYYRDPTTAGDAGLSAEKSFSYQAGYEGKSQAISYGVTLFLRQEHDFIDWVKHSPAQALWQVENITNAKARGIEAYLKYVMNKRCNLLANYTLTDKQIEEQGLLYKYGPNYAEHLLNMMFDLRLPFGVQTFGFSFKKKPNRRGWWLLSSRLSYDLNKHAQLFLDVTNLLNVEYQEIEGIPQPGRWLEAGMRVEW
ncbi:MAG: TonB-dependent receptor [Candidatus Omnitrophica bacterium]|nr:TonB-dependent receptor [Candidatus Omnitrophota bacterium]